jgi:hypothetical protein
MASVTVCQCLMYDDNITQGISELIVYSTRGSQSYAYRRSDPYGMIRMMTGALKTS